jgi:hypothetical protein
LRSVRILTSGTRLRVLVVGSVSLAYLFEVSVVIVKHFTGGVILVLQVRTASDGGVGSAGIAGKGRNRGIGVSLDACRRAVEQVEDLIPKLVSQRAVLVAVLVAD